jgi:hypothetical protein
MGEKRASRTVKSPKVFGHLPYRAKILLRAGLYARVSTQDQQTLPLQTRAMRDYQPGGGWSIVMQVKEIGSALPSGSGGRNCWRPRAAGRSTSY